MTLIFVSGKKLFFGRGRGVETFRGSFPRPPPSRYNPDFSQLLFLSPFAFHTILFLQVAILFLLITKLLIFSKRYYVSLHILFLLAFYTVPTGVVQSPWFSHIPFTFHHLSVLLISSMLLFQPFVPVN